MAGDVTTSASYVLRAGVPLNIGLDSDGDGLTDVQERVLGTNPGVVDTYGDGLSDFVEVGPDATYEAGVDTDPLDPDTDDGGLLDGVDPQPLVAAQARQKPAVPCALVLLVALMIVAIDAWPPRPAGG